MILMYRAIKSRADEKAPQGKVLTASLGLESDALDSKVLQISPLTSPCTVGTCLLSMNTTKKDSKDSKTVY